MCRTSMILPGVFCTILIVTFLSTTTQVASVAVTPIDHKRHFSCPSWLITDGSCDTGYDHDHNHDGDTTHVRWLRVKRQLQRLQRSSGADGEPITSSAATSAAIDDLTRTREMWSEQLHSHPDVYLLHNVINADEAQSLRNSHDRIVNERGSRQWCFQNRSILTRYQRDGLLSSREIVNGREGYTCVTASASDRAKLRNRLPSHTNVQLSRFEDVTNDLVESRLSRLLDLPRRHAYLTQLVKYNNGDDRFLPHTDCRVNPADTYNDRSLTVVLYLNDVNEGGETAFTRLTTHDGQILKVRPVLGSALIWSDVYDPGNYSCDLRTTHAALPPLGDGQYKYIYQKFFNHRRHSPLVDEQILCDHEVLLIIKPPIAGGIQHTFDC
jgi:hypothetical protein